MARAPKEPSIGVKTEAVMLHIDIAGDAPQIVHDLSRMAAEELGLHCRIRIEPLDDPMLAMLYGVMGYTEEGIREYTVKVWPGQRFMDEGSLEETIVHELRHVYQMESNRLRPLTGPGVQVDGDLHCSSWDGGAFQRTASLQWRDRPWERDAVHWADAFLKAHGFRQKTQLDVYREKGIEL